MDEELTIEMFKNIIIDMYRGYPEYTYVGTFEKIFGKKKAEGIISRLQSDGLIEVDLDIKRDTYYYELTSKGVDFAISMINLDLSKRTYNFNQQMMVTTKVLLLMTFGMFTFAFIQALITLGVFG